MHHVRENAAGSRDVSVTATEPCADGRRSAAKSSLQSGGVFPNDRAPHAHLRMPTLSLLVQPLCIVRIMRSTRRQTVVYKATSEIYGDERR